MLELEEKSGIATHVQGGSVKTTTKPLVHLLLYQHGSDTGDVGLDILLPCTLDTKFCTQFLQVWEPNATPSESDAPHQAQAAAGTAVSGQVPHPVAQKPRPVDHGSAGEFISFH